MGKIACTAITEATDLTVGAVVGRGDDRSVLAGCDVAVDLTTPESVQENVEWCIDAGICVVVGTSGCSRAWLASLRHRLLSLPSVGVVVAPNFSVGAALMARFAAEAGAHLHAAEIVELHHPRKADAPSGTALATALRMAGRQRIVEPGGPSPMLGSKERRQEGRGAIVEGIPVHSIRLSGLLAHQRVLFGGQGETLTITHDSYDRSAFMPGLLLAIREVCSRPGLTVGLENLLGL
jgi:4-hydroxy-tetrahydrodipicolinate reductase